MMKSFVSDTAVESAHSLIRHIIAQMNAEPDRVFYFAFSGGSAYSLLFDIWGNEYVDQTPWSRMRMFWVDENGVPTHDSDSNFGTMYRLLLQHVPGHEGWCFPIDGMANPQEEAQRYADWVKRVVPAGFQGMPAFDGVFLEAMPEGHLSSIRLGQESLLVSHDAYAVTVNPHTGQLKIGMTGWLMWAAKRLTFFMLGHGFQSVTRDIFQSGDTGPAVFVAHHGRDVELFMDQWARG